MNEIYCPLGGLQLLCLQAFESQTNSVNLHHLSAITMWKLFTKIVGVDLNPFKTTFFLYFYPPFDAMTQLVVKTDLNEGFDQSPISHTHPFRGEK